MKNIVIKIFLTIMMVISILPIASKTAYADESGTPGNPWHIEKLDGISVVTAWLTSDDINKTLHISGTGNMKNFDADDHPWKEDREKITTIVFEEEGSVTSIGNKAFVGCTALTRITIDSSVAHIGDYAFNGCGNLSTVIFRPAAEKETLTIADKAFATNQKLAYGSASMMRLYDGGNAIQAKADLSDYNNKTLTWKAYSYHLSVGGVEVTDSNKDNIFEDSGTVRASYNPESNTLKLNGVNIQPDDNNPLYGIYYNGTDALNIYLESGSENIVGVNNFAYGFTYGIYSTENAKISFSGTGKLKVTAGNGGTCSGIFAKGDMEINGSTVTSAASGYYNNGIVAKNLTINGGTVVSSANDLGEYTTTHGISVDTLVINTGAELTAIGKAGAISGAVKNAIAGTGWEDTAGTEGRTTIWIKTEGQSLDGRIKKVQFPGVTVYPITISGVQVDSSNKDDILYGTENQGKVSYDPDTKTLTLNGAVITEPNPFGGSNYTECIYIDEDDLTINVASGTTNSIRSSSKVGSGIVCTGDLTINGNGTLNVTADGEKDGAIVAYDLLSISEVNLSAEANNDAITGANGVSIRNATVTAASGKSKGIAVNDGKIIELGTNAVLTASGGYAALSGGANIDGATVTATSTNGYGILANDEETIEIGANAILTASGGNAALSGNVINAVNGIGWKDTGQVNIEISAAARKLDNDIKKVKFPAADPVARVTLSDGTAKVYTVFSTAVTEWKNANDATLKLLADVETSSNINLEKASGTRVLDLNGYGILYTGTSGSVIFIDDGVSLTMTDGDPTRVHYITLDSSGRGKVVSDTSSEGAIEVNGGYITGGLGYSFFGRNGGGVYAGGPFTMEGGTIVGNTANPASSYGQGGGVYVGRNSTFTMTGGTITRNTAGLFGGGVYVCNGATFNLSGDANITGNLKGAEKNNVELYNGRKITITGSLTDTSSIGVTMQQPGVFTISDNPKASDYINNFFSDDSSYSVDTTEDDELKLSGHKHNFTYSADGATITAECTAANCDLPGSKATLIIAAPLHTTYGDGKDAAAQITDTNSIRGDAKVQYQKKNGESYGEATETAPTDAGDYKASITLGSGDNIATAFVEYAVAKANPIANAPSGLKAVYGQTLADVELSNPEGNTPGSWSWTDSTTSVGTVGKHGFKANFTPTDKNNYSSENNVDVAVTVDKAANPVVVSGNAYVKKNGNTVDLKDNVTLNGATGSVSYQISGEAADCSLKGSELKSGDTTGTVTVNVNIAEDDNYLASDTKTITVTITDKDTQTITADNVTATYGDTDKKVSATVTVPATGGGEITYAVKQGSEKYIGIMTDSGELTILKAGTATVTVTAAATNDYAEATKDVTVIINKANPVATAPAASATYGQTLADVILTNPSGNTDGSWSWVDVGTTSVGNAGSKTFKANFKPDDTVNYNPVNNVDITVTVAKANPIAEAPTGLTATYGQTLADVALTNPEGNTPGTWSWKDSTTSVGDVGDNTFKTNFTPKDTNNYNSVNDVDVTVKVNKADSTAAVVSPNNRTYDATEKPLVTVSGEASGGTMNYALSEYGKTEPTTGWSEEIPSATNADTYYVWYKVFGDDNHKDTEAVPVEVKVSTVSLTVAAVNQNIKVGDEVPDISNPVLDTHYTVTGLVGEDKLTTAPTLTYKKDGSKVTPDSSKAGTYDIVASDAAAGSNYTVTHTDAKLTISNKEVQTITAENVTTTYGATDAKVTATTSGDGQISYAVKTGSSDYIDIDPSSGALTIKKEGTATVVVTAAETQTYAKATKEVTVTINPVDKSKLESAINAAKAFYNSIKDLPVYEATAGEVKSQIEAAEDVLNEGKTQQSVNEAESTLNNALAADLKKVADLLPGTDKATLDDDEMIKAAFDAFYAMTDTQKTLADEDTKNKIREDRVLMINIRNGHYYAYSGDGGRWTRGSGSTLPFVFKHSAVDDVTYRSFRSIKVDGRMVYEYTYIKGSVKIDLLPDYLKTLSLGDHTLTAEFAGGMSATASFRVLKESDPGGNTPYNPPKTGIE